MRSLQIKVHTWMQSFSGIFMVKFQLRQFVELDTNLLYQAVSLQLQMILSWV